LRILRGYFEWLMGFETWYHTWRCSVARIWLYRHLLLSSSTYARNKEGSLIVLFVWAYVSELRGRIVYDENYCSLGGRTRRPMTQTVFVVRVTHHPSASECLYSPKRAVSARVRVGGGGLNVIHKASIHLPNPDDNGMVPEPSTTPRQAACSLFSESIHACRTAVSAPRSIRWRTVRLVVHL
jgi:hypothetical protein